ncbi:LamB/YcsF family protein [Gluconacetobacter asukensis]|uniref:5-oxoprolinase subunit PxpA n=1 Tax=Gluconacetobacter asukensis TaxID=1017181 RepID=A0A7W4IZB5_9PROT|nr:5-oxoprolinase subunit PxpA [Gluconacetobacter asukensis]MBB2171858.1 5-oxoprolinase subunit PxpA [Gluconacetobacter asukensis]
MSPLRVSLVADLGESFGNYTIGDDSALLDRVTMANVACGFHAGDPRVMDETVRQCVERGVEIGAHPGYPDLVGFGRRAMEASEDEIRTDVLYQLGALSAFTRVHKTIISHLAPHGRMGSMATSDLTHALGVIKAAEAFDPSLVIICQKGHLEDQARKRGMRVAMVFLGDRAYGDDGLPVPRTRPGALLHDSREIAARCVQVVTEGLVRSVSGALVPLGHDVDTILLHGDNATAQTSSEALCQALDQNGILRTGVRDVLAHKA